MESLPLVVVLCIPLALVVGGVVRGILRTQSQQRLLELASRERIAALERGIDPEQLPPLQVPPDPQERQDPLSFEEQQLKSNRELKVWGLATTAFGFGLAVLLTQVKADPGSWAIGLVFAFVGGALLVGARLTGARNGTSARS